MQVWRPVFAFPQDAVNSGIDPSGRVGVAQVGEKEGGRSDRSDGVGDTFAFNIRGRAVHTERYINLNDTEPKSESIKC